MANDTRTQARKPLTGRELDLLRLAAPWGLLRSLAGERVCMTGRMSMPREQLEVLVEAAEGTFTNSMSGSVDLLVVPDVNHQSAKVQDAERRGLRVMTEAEFAAALLPSVEELEANQQGFALRPGGHVRQL